ncbi:PREDICTED: protein MIZU-KUSSEI 1-like [Ipomoea nil]|uniref:protein MIZU-KUSSEI 1-like n=1 Tax=Ipomoea nil TaxID=35883 RepID=UPI000900D620|nr:PREDICTED: protein MIZU-KUSSEI 1-like [Ipomoea nil]
MKTIMARSIQDSPSKRQFHWTTKVSNEEEEEEDLSPSSDTKSSDLKQEEEDPNKLLCPLKPQDQESAATSRQARAVSRLKSVLGSIGRNRIMQLLMTHQRRLGTKVVGTLFGHRRGGNVHIAFQKDPTSEPVFLVELATPISGLVREMASELVRIALECDKDDEKKTIKAAGTAGRLIDEPVWRTHCNGKKCGFANRRECGAKDWEILKSVEPISMGAGVLRIDGGDSGGGSAAGEIMYLRAKFDRVVGSRDSEAFYMMNPDSNGAPELSLYLLRV